MPSGCAVVTDGKPMKTGVASERREARPRWASRRASSFAGASWAGETLCRSLNVADETKTDAPSLPFGPDALRVPPDAPLTNRPSPRNARNLFDLPRSSFSFSLFFCTRLPHVAAEWNRQVDPSVPSRIEMRSTKHRQFCATIDTSRPFVNDVDGVR